MAGLPMHACIGYWKLEERHMVEKFATPTCTTILSLTARAAAELSGSVRFRLDIVVDVMLASSLSVGVAARAIGELLV